MTIDQENLTKAMQCSELLKGDLHDLSQSNNRMVGHQARQALREAQILQLRLRRISQLLATMEARNAEAITV